MPKQIFTDEEELQLQEVARIALGDTRILERVAVEVDVTDGEMAALRDKVNLHLGD